MPLYRGRLRHDIPGWVPDGAPFHIRFRVSWLNRVSLISGEIPQQLLESFRRDHEAGRWWCTLVLLMPDHIHAILRFPADPGMSETIRNWKRGATRCQGIEWQDGYFDHRLRSPKEVTEKWWYIRRNPVVKGLCEHEDDWPHWWAPEETW